jgi:hypothetical protein
MRIFIGPTGANIEDKTGFYPPAQQGDITTAVLAGVKTIVLIDGTFTQTLAPFHKEILYAISEGVTVIGAGSLGALRAVECERYGMIGIGKVFEWYKAGEIVDDSDVALTHMDASEVYKPLTVPLVNIKATAERLYALGKVFNDKACIEKCASICYIERSWAMLSRVYPWMAELMQEFYIDQKELDAREAIAYAKQHSVIPSCSSVNHANYCIQSIIANDVTVGDRKKWELVEDKHPAIDFYLVTEMAAALGIKVNQADIEKQSRILWKRFGVKCPVEAREWMEKNGVRDEQFNGFACRMAIRDAARDWLECVTNGAIFTPIANEYNLFHNKL